MKNTKNIMAIFLTLIFVTSLALTLPTTAQAPPAQTMKTYAIMDATPNPVGVGQETLLRFGVIEATGDASYGWTGITVTVVKPNGDSQTLGPFTTDSTGGTATIYTPDQVGTYKVTCNFPQQTNPVTFFNLEGGNMIFAGTIMKASNKTIDLVVQSEALPNYPDQPLPAEYWTRPIDAQLRSWFQVAGNWLSRGDNSIAYFNNDAPETAHVLWARDITAGGLTGGTLGDNVPTSHESGDAYEGKFSNSIVLNGVLFYNRMPAPISGVAYPQEGIYAVDLHTGKELWFKNGTTLSFGQTLYFNSFNTDGVFNYIWDATGPVWNAYEPSTGEWVYSMYNVPSGTRDFGPSGEILVYVMDYVNHRALLWNSTACGQQNEGAWSAEGGSIGSWGRNVHGLSWNGSNPHSYSWNISIPASLTAGTSFFTPILKVYNDRVMSMVFNQTMVRVWALGTGPSNRGQLIFDKTWSAPAEWLAGSNTLNYVGASDDWQDGAIAIWDKELTTHYAFSTETGDFLWSTASEHWLDAYGWGNAEHTWFFYGNHLYSVGVGGIVYAYNIANGQTDWTYNMTDAYNEPVTGNNWWGWIPVIADGKIYVGTLEHSAEQPIPRGGPFICLNATDGTEIWRVNGMYRQTRWGGNAIMGDSIIATMDTYDQRIYAVGKGPTQVTLNANPGVLALNDGVMLQGYVTDISPGTNSDALKMRFPNGVPAVADASQSTWMLYVYKQFAKPFDTQGVQVTLSALDANGNYRTLGTTTADANGFYSFNWTPDIEGKYTIYATFSGSKAYWGSFAETAFAVGAAAATPIPPATEQPSMVDQYFLAAVAAIIVVIVIIGVVLLIAVRNNRPIVKA